MEENERTTIIDCFFHFYESDEVFFHAIEICDFYLSQVLPNSIALDPRDIAKAILWLSIKFHTVNIAPDPAFLNLQKVEKHILQTIDYKLHFPTIYTHIEALDLKDSFHHDLIVVLCYLSVFQIIKHYEQSVITQAAYLLSCKLLHRVHEETTCEKTNICIKRLNKMYKVLLQQKTINRDHFIIRTYALLDYVPALDKKNI